MVMAAASVFLVLADDPEQSHTASADGKVTITGVARAESPFSISMADPVTGSVLVGDSYRVEQAGALDIPVVLAFSLDGLPLPVADVMVYRYDEDALMWEKALPIVAHTDDVIAIEARSAGTFALGVREDVTVPNFVAVYDDLRESPPEGAVGYVIMTGYSREGESAIRLPEVGDQGGCGGAVMPGVREERSVVTRSASLLVNDVQMPLTMTFLTRWFIGDGTGCADGLPFHSASEYGMLPTS